MRYLNSTFSALAIRDYRRYAFGQAVSVSGTWMEKLAQAWLVLEMTNSPLLLGITVALQQTPTLFFTNAGGALADRFDKRTILLCTAMCAMVPALAIGTLVQLDVVQIWMVMVAALVQGLSDAIDKPARLTFVNDIATPATLTNAVTLNGIIQDSGKLAGPAVAGLLIHAVGLSAAFFINAASFVPVIIALLLIKTRSRTSVPASFRAIGNLGFTVRYVAARPRLAATLAVMAVTGLLAYNWNVLLPTLTRNTFGGDARLVGFAFSSMGLGAVLGGLALAGFLKPTATWLIANGCALATSLTLLGAAPSLTIAYAVLFVVGASGVTFRATATSILQLSSDADMRGRVTSLLVLATAGTTPFGGPLIGWICEHASPRIGAVVGGVGVGIAVVVSYAYLRKVDRRANSESSTAAESLTSNPMLMPSADHRDGRRGDGPHPWG